MSDAHTMWMGEGDPARRAASEHYYTIEIISSRASLTPAAVRRYTRLGLLTPRLWRGRTPLYGEADVARLRKITRLTRDLGLNTAGVEIVLRLTDELELVRRQLAALQEGKE
jgi:MerR family transcriptional regulator/heat shock protein HspR